jgi:hypothetical protein
MLFDSMVNWAKLLINITRIMKNKEIAIIKDKEKKRRERKSLRQHRLVKILMLMCIL